MPSYNKLIKIARSLKSFDKYNHHVTFIFKKKRLLTIGINNCNKTHPRALKYNYTDHLGKNRSDKITIHSELAAIIKLGREDCRDLTFYNIRIDNNNKVNYSKPCTGCLHLLNQVGYKNIFYTNKSGNFKKLK